MESFKKISLKTYVLKMPAVWRVDCGWEVRQEMMVAGTGVMPVGMESSGVLGK